MRKSSTRRKICLALLKSAVIVFCLGGFLYQTLQFLMLYWTYPTVVDIQTVSSSTLEMPAFTICNAIGYNFDEICKFKGTCSNPKFNRHVSKISCVYFPDSCINGSVPADWRVISLASLMKTTHLEPHHHELLRRHLEEYTNCTIEFGGETKPCNLENVRGSFYTEENLPQYCYTIYSLWGKPYEKRETIQKGAKMKFHFWLNATDRAHDYSQERQFPMHNVHTTPAVQIAVHSPYFLFSPYAKGDKYLGGRSYQMRMVLKESRLLPAPYETNCTDYIKMWKERGGKAPINQMGMIQECRMNKFYDTIGCVPVTLDYPHNFTLCKSCSPEECDYNVSTNECLEMSENFNQPCQSNDYETTIKQKYIYFADKRVQEENSTTFEEEENLSINDFGSNRILEYDCADHNFWRNVCSTIDIEVLFDRFQTTRTTYNAKFESLELFSVIGGYLGMWLGVSLLTVYDFVGLLLNMTKAAYKKRQKNRVQLLQKKTAWSKPSRKGNDSTHVVTTYYDWQE